MQEARWRISGGHDVTYGAMCNGMYTGGGANICTDLSLDWIGMCTKRPASERAAFAYIMSDGVLCTELYCWF
jgi:hypothetical protein